MSVNSIARRRNWREAAIPVVPGFVACVAGGDDAASQLQQQLLGGQDDSLIAYAHEFCNTDGQNMWDTALPLAGQGVWPGQFYTLRVAASRAYCPDKGGTDRWE